MFIQEFNIDKRVVAKALIGVTSDNGFSGLRISSTTDGVTSEEYLLNGETIAKNNIGLLDEETYNLVRGKLNLVQYNLLKTIIDTKREKTYLSFDGEDSKLMIDEDESIASIPFRSFCPINNTDFNKGGHCA